MTNPRQVKILGIPDLGRSPIHTEDDVPADEVQKWSKTLHTLARATVSADAAWDSFNSSRFVHQSDKRRRTDLCDAMKRECRLLVMCGRRESGAAAATALLIAIHAMENAHRGTIEALNKTVVVAAKEKIAAVATLLENTVQGMHFAQYGPGKPTHVYRTGINEFTLVHPQADGIVTDANTALWMINNGTTGTFILDPSADLNDQITMDFVLSAYEQLDGMRRRKPRFGRLIAMRPLDDLGSWDPFFCEQATDRVFKAACYVLDDGSQRIVDQYGVDGEYDEHDEYYDCNEFSSDRIG